MNLVIRVFLDSDKDESGTLDDREIRVLSMKLSLLEGTEVNQELFQQKVKEDSSMSGTIAILRASLQKDVEPDDQVFTFAAAGI